MKKIGVIVLMLTIVNVFAQDESVKPQKLTNQKFEWVKFKIPQDFVEMEDEAFFRTTASAVKPEIAFRDPSAQVTFTINNSINRWGNNLVMLQQFQRANILAMHKKVNYTRDEVVEIKKRKYLIMIFDSKVDDKTTPDGKKRVKKFYTAMVYTVKEGHLITIVLRLPHWMKEEGWAEATEDIVNSIRVK